MNPVQTKLFEALCDFDDFCREHGIRYYLAAGSVLGAVRHQGFIPWDDDLDVVMTRKEYDRLIPLMKKELNPDKYFVQDFDSDPTVYCFWAKLRINGTTFVENGAMENPMHQGLSVDLFPVYPAAPPGLSRRWQSLFSKVFRALCLTHVKGRSHYVPLAKLLKRVFGERRLYRFCEKQFSKYPDSTDEYFDPAWYRYERCYFKKRWYGEPEYYLFEGRLFPCPTHTEEYLISRYGDYMTPPPEDKRSGHVAEIVDPDKDYSEYTGFHKPR